MYDWVMRLTKLTLLLISSTLLLGCSTTEEKSTSSSSSEVTSSESTSKNKQFVMAKKDNPTENGSYDYEVVIKPDLTLTLDIDLTNTYQDIDGKYNLHYEIDENKVHTMIVSGKFDNIIVNSPLVDQVHPEMAVRLVKIGESLGFLSSKEDNEGNPIIEEICADPANWVRTNISDDSYSYKLDLKTDEGFSFTNALSLLAYGKEHGYTISFEYSSSSSSESE